MNSGTPTWVIITAVFLMLIGGCGVKNDIQSIGIRDIMAKTNEMFRKSAKLEKDSTVVTSEEGAGATPDSLRAEADSITALQKKETAETFDRFKKMLDIPESTINKIIMLGYIGLFFSVFLILAGLFLLLKKTFSIRLAYAALILSIVFSLVKWFMLSGENNTLLTVGTGLSAAFTFIICTIFLIIIFSSDKSYLEDQPTEY